MFTRAAIVPTIGKVAPTFTPTAPATIARGTEVGLTIKGVYFLPDVRVFVFGNGLTFDSVIRLSATTITVRVIAAANADLATASVVVADPGTGAGESFGTAAICTCLEVTG